MAADKKDAGDKDIIMTVQELAKYLRVDKSTIYRLLKTPGAIPAFRVAGDWRFSKELIDEWVRRQSGGSFPEGSPCP
jgi:excisionase family DNA binding protein